MPSLLDLWKRFGDSAIGHKFIRDVGVLTVANFLGAALSFAQGILVARLLGPELYGMAALVMTYPSLVRAFFDARSVEASVKYLSEFHGKGDRDRVLATCKLGYLVDLAIASFACFVVSITARWAASEIAHNPEAYRLIIIYAAAFIPRGFLGTSHAVLTTLGKFSAIAWIDVLMTLVRVVLVIGTVLGGWQVAGVVWANAIATAVTGFVYGAISWMLIRRTWGAFPYRGNLQALERERRQLFSFLFYNNMNALLGMIPKQLDIIILGYFRNPTEVGYYQLAKKFTSIVSYLVRPLQSVSYPQMARLWGLGNAKDLRQKVRKFALYIGLPLGLAILASLLFVPIILPVVFGEEYRPAVTAMQYLLVGSAIWLAVFWLRPLYFTMDKVKQWGIGIGVYALVFALLSIPLTFHYGYLGMSLSQSVSVSAFHLIMAGQVFR